MARIEERRKRRARRRRKEEARKPQVYKGIPLSRVNWILFWSGIGFAALGFILLKIGDEVFSTISLVLGYVILIPLSLIWGKRG